MAIATWKGQTVAQSETFEVVEGNVYFPPGSVNSEHLQPSTTRTRCAWKGEASYYHVVVDGAVLRDAAWYYPEPSQAAAAIRDHVAFWKGVEVKR